MHAWKIVRAALNPKPCASGLTGVKVWGRGFIVQADAGLTLLGHA